MFLASLRSISLRENKLDNYLATQPAGVNLIKLENSYFSSNFLRNKERACPHLFQALFRRSGSSSCQSSIISSLDTSLEECHITDTLGTDTDSGIFSPRSKLLQKSTPPPTKKDIEKSENLENSNSIQENSAY